jgi:hypothetical protein
MRISDRGSEDSNLFINPESEIRIPQFVAPPAAVRGAVTRRGA